MSMSIKNVKAPTIVPQYIRDLPFGFDDKQQRSLCGYSEIVTSYAKSKTQNKNGLRDSYSFFLKACQSHPTVNQTSSEESGYVPYGTKTSSEEKKYANQQTRKAGNINTTDEIVKSSWRHKQEIAKECPIIAAAKVDAAIKKWPHFAGMTNPWKKSADKKIAEMTEDGFDVIKYLLENAHKLAEEVVSSDTRPESWSRLKRKNSEWLENKYSTNEKPALVIIAKHDDGEKFFHISDPIQQQVFTKPNENTNVSLEPFGRITSEAAEPNIDSDDECDYTINTHNLFGN